MCTVGSSAADESNCKIIYMNSENHIIDKFEAKFYMYDIQW